MAEERNRLRENTSGAEMNHCCMSRCDLNSQDNRRFNQVLAILSSFLLSSINGFPLTLGNLSVYTTSYTKVLVNSGKASESMWTYSLYVACFGFGVFLTTASDKKLSRRLVCILASCLFVTGMMSSYFTLQKSVYALPITLGAFCGFAGGSIATTSLQLVYPWMDKGQGLVISVIKTSAAINGFVLNYFVTFVINPEDERPNVLTTDLSYFSQEKILNRVPFVFVYMGLINALILLVGCILIREKKLTSLEDTNKNIVTNQIDKKDSEVSRFSCFKRSENVNLLENNYAFYMSSDFVTKKIPADTRDNTNEKKNGTEMRRHHSTPALDTLTDINPLYNAFKRHRTQSISNVPSSLKFDNSYFERIPSSSNANKSQHSYFDEQGDSATELTYKNLLKSRTFCLTCLTLVLFSWHFNITLKYYKLFAQIWIHDDHFLTNLGTLMSVSLVFTRPLWGYVTDRFGIKDSLVFAFSLTSSVFSWLYFTPGVNPWLYSVVVYILWNTVNAHPVFSPAVPLKIYGEKNFAKAYGLQASALTLGNLCMPFLVQLSLEFFSWDTIFAIVAMIGVVGLVLVIKCFPNATY